MITRTKALAACIVSAICVLPTVAHADPCGTELCLSDFSAAKKDISTCQEDLDEFFSLVGKKHGHFDPGRTLEKRRKYLNKCPSGNAVFKADILSKYGSIVKPSY